MKYVTAFAAIVFFFFAVSAQEFCNEISNKKAIQLYKKGTDKHNKKDKRMEYLREALELEPGFVEANFVFAEELVKTINYRGGKYTSTEKYFQKVIDLCPDYHSDPYYYLALIQFDKGNYDTAIDLFQKFMKFQSDNDDAYARDYDKKYQDAKESIRIAKFYRDVYNKPVPFNPELVTDVSTEADEYLPLITPDNTKLLFTRRTEKTSRVRQHVYESDKKTYIERFSYADHTGNNHFTAGEPFPYPFNQKENYNYGGATISINNKELFLTICKPAKMGYINCDIYTSKWVYGYNEQTGVEEWHWTELENLGPNVNTEDGWESQPSLSADGKQLFFASARADSRLIDIYVSERQPDGTWSPAKNIGEPINTEGNDKSPFIHSDSHTLYFSSDGHLGFGKMDVFYSRLQEDGTWSEPKNIGTPINSEEDEHGFVVSTDGKRVYFGSDKLKSQGKGGFDIFSFYLYKEARPEKVVFLKGTLKDENNEVIKDATIEIKNPKTNEIKEFKVDSTDGSYAAVVTLKKNDKVIMNVKSDEKDIFYSKLFTEKDTADTFVNLDMNVKTLEKGKTIQINDIHYATNSAEIVEESKLILDELVALMKKHPTMKIAIYGHTDNQGDMELNMALSTDRAFSVMEYLQQQGIEKNRLTFKGFGPTKPIATNDTEEGRALNRRTEFKIIDM
ncbi:MAG: hypothetical protein D6707_03865 [Bacteroidetes bacterium]|nr:MAG: hypothetical protein D6707_03865 [Bacteroidota bacterium]